MEVLLSPSDLRSLLIFSTSKWIHSLSLSSPHCPLSSDKPLGLYSISSTHTDSQCEKCNTLYPGNRCANYSTKLEIISEADLTHSYLIKKDFIFSLKLYTNITILDLKNMVGWLNSSNIKANWSLLFAPQWLKAHTEYTQVFLILCWRESQKTASVTGGRFLLFWRSTKGQLRRDNF